MKSKDTRIPTAKKQDVCWECVGSSFINSLSMRLQATYKGRGESVLANLCFNIAKRGCHG